VKPPGPRCTICEHPRRAEIDADLRQRSVAVVSKAFDVSRSALGRHRKHLGTADDAPLVIDDAPVDPRALTVDVLKALRACLKGTGRASVPAVAKAIGPHARLLARLDGQLEITQAQIVRSRPWRELMALLDEVLERHPEAAKEWALALERAEGDG